MYLVTGGKSEIAIAIANKLALLEDVLLVTRNKMEFPTDKLHQNVNLQSIDLAEESAFKELWRLIEQFDIRKFCFAHRFRGDAKDDSSQFEVEVMVVHRLISALTDLPSSEEKRIVLITSPAAEQILEDQNFMYHACKTSLLTMARFFAVRFGRQGIIVNSVAPGSFVEKDRSKAYYESNKDLSTFIKQLIPSGMPTSKEDIASQVEYLLEAAPRSLNGAHLVLDSGLTLKEPSGLTKIVFS